MTLVLHHGDNIPRSLSEIPLLSELRENLHERRQLHQFSQIFHRIRSLYPALINDHDLGARFFHRFQNVRNI